MWSIRKFMGQVALVCAAAGAAQLSWAAVPAMPSGAAPGTTAAPGPVQADASVKLQWSAVANASYYDIGVRDLVTNALVVDTTTTSPVFTKTLQAGKPYRWNVAACNASGCSAYTKALYFQTPAPRKTLSSVSVECPSAMNEGASVGCSATARFSDNSAQLVTASASWSENSPYATISSSGLLTAAQVSADQAVKVTAEYSYNGTSKVGTAAVTILDARVIQFNLNVSTAGTGSGKVTSNVGGINCGAGATACTASYQSGTSVVLTAVADAANSTFAGWTGACAGTPGNVCSLAMVPPRTSLSSTTASFTKRANQAPTIATVSAIQNADGSLTVAFLASDPEGAVLGVDAYISNAGGAAFNAGSKKSAAGIMSGTPASITWTRAQADQYMVAGQTYTIAVDAFDPQALASPRKVTAAFKRSAAAATLNERISSAALAQVGASSPRSLASIATLFDELDPSRSNTVLRSEGKTWLTDLEDGSTYQLQDGARLRNAIRRYSNWDASPASSRETYASVKAKMEADIGQVDTGRSNPPALYDATRRAKLAAQIVAVWDAKKLAFNQRTPGALAPAVPSNDQETMDFLGFRAQCFEWVASVGLRAGAKSISYASPGVTNRLSHRAGMAMFWYTANGSGAHASIITSIESDASGNPTYYHVAESNYASGWQNPGGAIPWERTVRGDRRLPAVANQVTSPTDMTRQGRVVQFVQRN